MHLSSQPIMWQQYNTDTSQELRSNAHRISVGKRDRRDSGRAMAVDARQAGLISSETAKITWDFHTQRSLECTQNGVQFHKHG